MEERPICNVCHQPIRGEPVIDWGDSITKSWCRECWAEKVHRERQRKLDGLDDLIDKIRRA